MPDDDATPGPAIHAPRQSDSTLAPAAQVARTPGTPGVIDASGPGDNTSAIIIGGVDVTDPNPAAPPQEIPDGFVRLRVAWPGTYFAPGGDLPVITSAGSDVDRSQAQAILDAAANAHGVTVEEVV